MGHISGVLACGTALCLTGWVAVFYTAYFNTDTRTKSIKAAVTYLVSSFRELVIKTKSPGNTPPVQLGASILYVLLTLTTCLKQVEKLIEESRDFC